MGSLHAIESADMVNTGQLSLDDALQYHLASNHYPPVSSSFIPVAKQAIALANDANFLQEEEIWKQTIDMPNGKSLTVSEIIEGLHLEWFLEQNNED
jgi:hypothetical protein